MKGTCPPFKKGKLSSLKREALLSFKKGGGFRKEGGEAKEAGRQKKRTLAALDREKGIGVRTHRAWERRKRKGDYFRCGQGGVALPLGQKKRIIKLLPALIGGGGVLRHGRDAKKEKGRRFPNWRSKFFERPIREELGRSLPTGKGSLSQGGEAHLKPRKGEFPRGRGGAPPLFREKA